MDLLITPDDPAFPLQRAPYVCASVERWDCGSFLSYAQRKGKLRSVPMNLRRPHRSKDSVPGLDPTSEEPYLEPLYPSPRTELEPFYQTWFYFGLVAEFWGLNEPPENGHRLVSAELAILERDRLYEDFVRDEEDGEKYITGAKLLQKDFGQIAIERVRAHNKTLDDWKATFSHWRECLHFAQAMINTAIHTDIDDPIVLAIGALGEFLTNVVHATIKNINDGQFLDMTPYLFNWQLKFCPAGGRLEKELIVTGWCPSDVERMRTMHKGFNTQHYLSQLKLHGGRRDHSQCTKAVCRYGRIDQKSYRPSHAQGCAGCAIFKVDESAIGEVLTHTSSYPVLSVKTVGVEAGDVAADVKIFQPGMLYVALSHVWADGLGNPDKNAIPECQVGNLAQILRDVDECVSGSQEPSLPGSMSSSKEKGETHLWLDTLCCPIDAAGQQLALSRISEVYRNATHVLVLDATLTSGTSKEKPAAELLARVFAMSTWMRRLWTLQGMYLNARLLTMTDHMRRGLAGHVALVQVRRSGCAAGHVIDGALYVSSHGCSLPQPVE